MKNELGTPRLLAPVIFAFALGAGVSGLTLTTVIPGTAFAETHDDGGTHEKGPGSSGHEDDGHDDGGHDDSKGKGPGAGGHEDGGHETGGEDDGGHEDGGHEDGGGKGGENKGGEGKGAEGNKGGNAEKRPVWAKEGIPEVELGRLNVARSPDQVINRAYDEALSSFTQEKADFYNLSLSRMIEELSLNRDGVSFIDSPLQNLALFREALDGTSVLKSVGVTSSNDTLLAAFLGTASDKTVPITKDTVIAITTILGDPVSGAQANALAANAERIRIAILAGHN